MRFPSFSDSFGMTMPVWAILLLVGAVSSGAQPLELVDVAIPGAELVSIDSGDGASFTAGDESITRPIRDIVRWGHPAAPRNRPTLLLADGSRLVAAEVWTAGGSIQLASDSCTVVHPTLGRLELPRNAIKVLLLAGGRDPALLAPVRAEVMAPVESDTLWLVEGDRLTGEVKACNGAEAEFVSAGETVKIAAEWVIALALAGDQKTPPADGSWLGLSDGSLLRATSLAVTAKEVRGTFFSEQAFKAPLTAVVFWQPLVDRVQNLSDSTPLDYRHAPYFQLQRPFARDTNLQGDALIVQGRRYLKGLAMPSAARLTYKLDGEPATFQALIGIDDSAISDEAPTGGSAVFQVYAVRDGKPERLFDSGIVRSGEALKRVSVDISGATGLALVVDYGEFGDQRDEAVWLDARLVTP
jgi:hypothetical protein